MNNVEAPGEAPLDRLLSGRAGTDEDPAGIARFAEDLRAAFITAPAPAVEKRHLAAMLEAVRVEADEPEPGRTPVVAGLGALLPWWRRKPAVRGTFAALTAKVVAFTVAATTVNGGLAAAGVLPQPVHDIVAAAAAAVGMDLSVPNAPVPTINPEQATAAAASLEALAGEVADTAARPHEIGLPIAEAAQACASKVSSLGEEIAASAAVTSDPAAAVTLAERATAIAREAVECAVPKAAGEAAPAPGVVVTTTPDASAIVDVVDACVADLKPHILALAASAAGRLDPVSAATLASKAGALAARAAECAGDVAAAAGIAFALPEAPAVPGTAIPVPSPQAPTTPETAPSAPEVPAPVALPSPVPQVPQEWSSLPTMPTTSAEAWMELMGSWEGFEHWMPSGTWYPSPSPEETPAP